MRQNLQMTFILLFVVVHTFAKEDEEQPNAIPDEAPKNRTGKFIRFIRPVIPNNFNPNFQIVKRLTNPNVLVARPTQEVSIRLPFSFMNQFSPIGKLLKLFRLAKTTTTTTTSTTTTPTTTTTSGLIIRMAATCTEAATICPSGTSPKPLETIADVQGLPIVGGSVYAGANTGVPNLLSNGASTGTSFTWPSGSVISSTDTDPRWDDLTEFPVRARTDNTRTCLFWDNNGPDPTRLRTRQPDFAADIIVICE